MKNANLVGLLAAPLMVCALALPVWAADPATPATPTTCKDGTKSSAAGKGACSGHGGVDKAMAMTPATPAAAAPATTTKKTPTTCVDGTTSTATGRGACSSHGGVQKSAKKPADSTAPAQ
jgi:hypothetical protein